MIPEVRPDPKTVLLDGNIWLPPVEHGSRVQPVLTSSEGASETKLALLRRSVESHPEWSDAQAASALKQAGARFGPDEKQAFISSLPFDKSERFLGRLKITSVEFTHLRPGETRNHVLRQLDWRVEAEAHFSDGTSAKYVFAFEPFEGKLTFLSRRP